MAMNHTNECLFNCAELSWGVLKWTRLNSVALKLTKMNWILLDWNDLEVKVKTLPELAIKFLRTAQHGISEGSDICRLRVSKAGKWAWKETWALDRKCKTDCEGALKRKEMKYRWPSPSSDRDTQRVIGTFSLSCFELLHVEKRRGVLENYDCHPPEKSGKNATHGRTMQGKS